MPKIVHSQNKFSKKNPPEEIYNYYPKEFYFRDRIFFPFSNYDVNASQSAGRIQTNQLQLIKFLGEFTKFQKKLGQDPCFIDVYVVNFSIFYLPTGFLHFNFNRNLITVLSRVTLDELSLVGFQDVSNRIMDVYFVSNRPKYNQHYSSGGNQVQATHKHTLMNLFKSKSTNDGLNFHETSEQQRSHLTSIFELNCDSENFIGSFELRPNRT